MRLCHLKIERFRGINLLEWTVKGDFLCFIGPGDATKSTILDAVELALSARRDHAFDDSDFYESDTSQSIIITATLTQLPEAMLSDSKFGREIRGWSEDSGLRDEPGEHDEPALSIRLTVDASLEPEWTVYNERTAEPRYMMARDRQAIGLMRLGASIDRQFTWNDGTVLSRITGKVEELPSLLAEAARAARGSVAQGAIKTLADAAARVQELGKKVGVAPRKAFGAGLDLRRVNVGSGGMALHDGNIPLRRAGLGTRRLLAVALQREIIKDGGITLVDELEHGLEPHRLRSLIDVLRPVTGDEGQPSAGQVLMTTHSPIAVVTVDAAALKVVRTKDGTTRVIDIDPSLQNIIRAAPEAFLGRRIIVCEGPTEVGLLMGLDRSWQGADGAYNSFAYRGIVPVDGGGSQAPTRAVALAQLGYDVAFLGDSDQPTNPTPEQMTAAGVKVHIWDASMNTEARLARDLPWDKVKLLVALAARERGDQRIVDEIRGRIGGGQVPASAPAAWADAVLLRTAIGAAAHANSWFKRIGLGKEVAGIVAPSLTQIPTSDLAVKLSSLRAWITADA
jgi:hypothetical protein